MNVPLTAALGESLHRHASELAIVQHQGRGEARSVTYRELGALADRMAASPLGSLGRDATAGLFMRRSPEHVACLLGALGRTTCYSINPMVSATQIAEMVDRASTRLLCIDNAGLLKLSKLSPDDVPGLRILLVPDGPLGRPHEMALEKLSARFEVASLPEEGGSPPPTVHGPDDPALILFTSGSTGAPRGVMIGHRDLALRVEAEAAAYGIGAGERLLSVLPFSFDVGCNQLLSSLVRGAALVIVNSWLAGDIVGAIQRHGVTGISAVPALWTELFKHDEDDLRSTLVRLRYLTISAGDLPEKGHDRLRELAPGAAIYKTYGQTETFRSGMLLPQDYDRKRLSVGRPPPGVGVSVVRPDGAPAAADEEGEIVHVGVGTMLGYVGDPEATAAKLRPCPAPEPPADGADVGRCVFTGDRGRIDAEGFLFVLGRRDRMLKIRGNRVYPEEIERQLQRQPDVESAIVLTRSDGEGGVVLVAGVKLVEGSTEDEKSIKRALAGQLPSYMLPERVLLVSRMPRTATGKIDLPAARALVESLHRA